MVKNEPGRSVWRRWSCRLAIGLGCGPVCISGTCSRTGLALLAAIVLCVILRAWDPPFAYREGYVPPGDIVAQVSFDRPDRKATEDSCDRARSRVRCIYVLHPEKLEQLRGELRNRVAAIAAAAKLSDAQQQWEEFQPAAADDDAPPTPQDREAQFAVFREAIGGPDKLGQFEERRKGGFGPFEQRGLLSKFPPSRSPKANFEEIVVQPEDHAGAPREVKVGDVMIGDGTAIRESLQTHFNSAELATRLFAWLRPRLHDTLILDEEATRKALDAEVAKVPEVTERFEANQLLAKAGHPLERRQITLLRLARRQGPGQSIAHPAA